MRAPLAPELMRYPEGPPMGYGYRGNIGVPGASTFHEGIDIGIPTGTPVYAVADGQVVLTTDSGAPGISILYQIDPTTRIRCNHFSKRYFSRGQSFREGRVIGLSGNTGASGGPHLHFSVFKLRNGSYKSIDPTPWLRTMLSGTAGGATDPEEDDMTPKEVEQLLTQTDAVYKALFGPNNGPRAAAAPLKWADIGGHPKSVGYGALDIIIHNQSLIAQQAGKLSALSEAVSQLTGGGKVDMAAVEAAAERGARDALAAGWTLTPTIED